MTQHIDRNWRNFLLQQGRWHGDWVRYNCKTRASYERFRGIRDLPMITPQFMDHTNHYQSEPGGPWVQRAFRGYRKEVNSTADGIMHTDLPDSRGVFFSHGTGIFSHVQLGSLGGLEVYMIDGTARFSTVLQFGMDGTLGRLSYIREELDPEKRHHWSNQVEMSQGPAELPLLCGNWEDIAYPSLEMQQRIAVGQLHLGELTSFCLPDFVTIYSPNLDEQPDPVVAVTWQTPSGGLKIVVAGFTGHRLSYTRSFSSFCP